MTFTPVFTLDPNPVVRVLFSGLSIIKPEANGSTCEAFVHRTALDHVASIEIRLKRPNQNDVVIARIGPLEFAVTAPGAPAINHGFLLVTTQAEGIRGYDGSPTAEGQSLLHLGAIDLFNLHRGKTAVDAPVGRPSIFMNDAVFYSAEMTDPELIIDLYRNGVKVGPMTPFASLIGANIYNPTTATWREHGNVRTIKLNPLPNGAHYEIYVINDPLFQPPLLPGEQPHDELQEYYKLLSQVPQGEQFHMVFVHIPVDDRGSTRTPCMTVIDNS